MPRKPVDYSRTIIYKIVCKDLQVTQCYVGHTTDFTNRKRCHKINCYNENGEKYHYYLYTCIRENGGFENFDMIEIEKYPCLDVYEAHKRERYWIETLNAELNKYIPTRTHKEYYEQNRDYFLEKKKEWNIQNKEKIYNHNKEYYAQNKEQWKNYRNQHKEQIKEYNKNWYEKNKEEINRKRREQRALKKQQSSKEDA